MNKSVKKLMPLTLSLLAVTLSGCGSVAHSVADSISLSYRFLSLFEGETKTVEVRTTPRSKDPADLEFTSSDTSVATVNDKGEVQAKKAGRAVITVKDRTSGVETMMDVSVDKDDLARSEAKAAAKEISDYQIAHSMKAKKVHQVESYYFSRSKNDVLQNSTYFAQDMIVSVDDAYFYIGSDDENIKVEGGSKEYSSSAWYIYTNASFDTYLFHIDGITKTYMVCDSTSFIGSGGTRYDALLEVISNLFTSGSKIITNTLNDVIGKDNLDSAKNAEIAGSKGNGSLTYEMTQSGKATADKDDEDDNNIPYGTQYDINIRVRYAWEEYYCVAEDIIQDLDFMIDDDKYQDHYKINNYYDHSDFELVYPDREAFTKVDDIFDL